VTASRLAVLLLSSLGALASWGASARGQESAPEPVRDVFTAQVRKALERQDRLVDERDHETLLREARERVEDATPDNYYLLGRALGNTALHYRTEKDVEEFERLLGEARKAFGKAKELGGLLYAPAHLGLARCRMFQDDSEGAEVELRKALEIEPVFREAVIVLAQVLWQRGLQRDAEFELYGYLQQQPGDTQARSLLGMFKMKRKRWAEAEVEFAAVLRTQPDDLAARKGLGTVVMFQRRYEEAAEHLERARAMEPDSDDVYMTLYHVYEQLRDAEKARRVLEEAVRRFPDTEVARRAADRLSEIEEDPEAWASGGAETLEELVSGLDSADPRVVLRTLRKMQATQWKLLPAGVYRLLTPGGTTPEVRRQAVRLIGQVDEPRTLTILEIKLFHPKERDPSLEVRRETARAIAKLPSGAALFVLWEALHEDDVEIREAAVQGIASRTGRWFRADLYDRTAEEDWPDELARYERWWATGSASIAKRKAVAALATLYASIRDRKRPARYLLHAMDDRNPRTWRAAYDLFRTWCFVSFGMDEEESVSLEDRERIAAEARAWLDEQLGGASDGEGGD
jgi:tetratricopeptide (TPR) repeat protein